MRQEAASEGMRLEKRDDLYRLVATYRIPLLGSNFAWPWQTLHKLVELMFGEPKPPEVVLVGNTYMSAKMA